jgi:hypothetical protein
VAEITRGEVMTATLDAPAVQRGWRAVVSRMVFGPIDAAFGNRKVLANPIPITIASAATATRGGDGQFGGHGRHAPSDRRATRPAPRNSTTIISALGVYRYRVAT